MLQLWNKRNGIEVNQVNRCCIFTIGGHLAPTAPMYEDVRTDSTLNVTPEESLGDVPAAVVGTEERESTQQIGDKGRSLPSNVVPSAAEVPETNLNAITRNSTQVEPPRRVEITRESSREDAIAATRHFFTMVSEQRNTSELPVVNNNRCITDECTNCFSCSYWDRTHWTRNYISSNLPSK